MPVPQDAAEKLALLTFLAFFMHLPVGLFLFLLQNFVPGLFSPPDVLISAQARQLYEHSGPAVVIVAAMLVAAWWMGLLRGARIAAVQAVVIAIAGPLISHALEYDMRILPILGLLLPWPVLYASRYFASRRV